MIRAQNNGRHRSFSDPFWYMTDQIQFGRTYLLYISNGEAIDSLQ